jgi:hypothetical protein
MSQRTIYLLNALGLVVLIALNTIDFPGWPTMATGILQAVLIPAAWFIGSWYGRADMQAGLQSAMNSVGMTTRPGPGLQGGMANPDLQRALQPGEKIFAFDPSGGDDRTVIGLRDANGWIGVADAGAVPPDADEKTMAELNETLHKYGLPPINSPPRACND